MNIYTDVIEKIKNENYASEYYRFQGGRSFKHFNIKTSKFDGNPNDSYTYFSVSPDHHKYFLRKRIRQLLNKTVLNDTRYIICRRDLSNPESYSQIKKLIINSEKLSDLYSLRLITDIDYYELIQDNCFKQENKSSRKAIERVDRRVYGGGYGVAAEWKELLNCLTYFDAYRRIDREQIIEIVSSMGQNSQDVLSKLLKSPKYTIDITPSLESNFTKYKITYLLETIIEKGLLSSDSNLNKQPTKTIKQVVTNHENRKEKILKLLDNHKINK